MFSECVLLYLVQVSTHLAMLPSVYAVWRMGHGTMLGCGVATLVTSLLYHLCEVMNNQQCWRGTPNVRLLGLTDGNWCVCSTFFFFFLLFASSLNKAPS
jgi:hypothetical protein